MSHYSRGGKCLLVIFGLVNLGLCQSVPQGPLRDPQALAVLTKVVNAAGGVATIAGLTDFTASGHVTFYRDQVLDGDVTLTGRAFDFRVDANLPNGAQSWYILKSQGLNKDTDGTISSLLYQQVTSVESLNLPLVQLLKALSDPSVNVSFLGSAVRAGRPVYGIRIRTLSAPYSVTGDLSKLVDKNFFFDTSTFYTVCIEDFSFPTNGIVNGVRRQVQFSNYQTVQGMTVPMSIVDAIGAQQFTVIALTQISFNAGYTDSQFQP